MTDNVPAHAAVSGERRRSLRGRRAVETEQVAENGQSFDFGAGGSGAGGPCTPLVDMNQADIAEAMASINNPPEFVAPSPEAAPRPEVAVNASKHVMAGLHMMEEELRVSYLNASAARHKIEQLEKKIASDAQEAKVRAEEEARRVESRIRRARRAGKREVAAIFKARSESVKSDLGKMEEVYRRSQHYYGAMGAAGILERTRQGDYVYEDEKALWTSSAGNHADAEKELPSARQAVLDHLGPIPVSPDSEEVVYGPADGLEEVNQPVPSIYDYPGVYTHYE